MFVVTYRGIFGFIKPWTAVRDGETFSQQFLTPSIIEGIEKKLFPELLNTNGIHKILRHKLDYAATTTQQEVVQTRGWEDKKGKMPPRPRSIIKRSILQNPILYLAFNNRTEALSAYKQTICLCRNEDILFPDKDIAEMTAEEFSSIPGFELRFGKSEQSFLVGYNRFNKSQPMYGWLEYNGQTLL